MKDRELWLGISIITLVFGIMLGSCDLDTDSDTYKYTVWNNTFRFSTSDNTFGTLQDGYYLRFELSDSEFEWEKSNNFKNSPQNIWTKDQINSYLIGLGFDNTKAEKESAWLASIKHGCIGSRNGAYLYVILK